MRGSTPRWEHPTGAAFATLLYLLIALAGLPAAGQIPRQVTTPEASVPPPPSGSGTIHGQLVSDDPTAVVTDQPVALYALRADGSPGLQGTRTDDAGRFSFENVSSDPKVLYLVGAQYRDVPFAQRITFSADQEILEVDLFLRRIEEDASALAVLRSVYKLDWIGRQLSVQVSHLIRNPGQTVIHVEEERRSDTLPILLATLPEETARFGGGEDGTGGDFQREGENLSAWGPVYPGSQELRYGFLITEPRDDSDDPKRVLEFLQPLPAGSGDVQILLAEGNSFPMAEELGSPSGSLEIEGQTYLSYSAGEIAVGGEIAFRVDIPKNSNDSTALRLTRGDYWIDHDDTQVRVTANFSLEVSGSARLAAGAGEPLLRIALPPDAVLGPLPGADALGLEVEAPGTLALRGPLPPGKSSFSYRYRQPVDGPVHLDLNIGHPLDLLNVLVADNGVEIEADRLHRKRPFKQGTRFYLHREAYQLGAGEKISVTLTPLVGERDSRRRGRLAAFGLAVLIIGFVIMPLRAGADPAREAEAPVSSINQEREALYESIRDLDHDFETGKLDEGDYRGMRAELRALAVDLMRQQQEPDPGTDAISVSSETALCPGCGTILESNWRFCSDCGREVLHPRDAV